MMGKKRVNEEWGEEFLEFINAEEVDPPEALSEKVQDEVGRNLTPPIWKILLKFGLIQFAVSFMTLLFCPQFELDLGLIKHDDAHSKVLLGEAGYMALCGVIFLGSGSLLASMLLRVEELRALKKTEYLYLFLASAVALMIFRQLGSPAIQASYAAWFSGAFGGSAAAFEIIKRLKLNGREKGAALSA
ncbi:MAG: hypothetical protein RQ824_03675 [bacterium]|nr:hypothetical protein [bacterium]